MAGKERFKSRKVYKTDTKANGDGTDDVWKTDERFDFAEAMKSPNTPGSGFVKSEHIPRASAEPHKGRPGKPRGGTAAFEAAYRKATRKKK